MKISFEIMPNATYKNGDETKEVVTDVAGKRSPLYQIIEKNCFRKILETKKIALIAAASFGKTTMMTDLRIKLTKMGEIFFSVSLFDFQKGKQNIDDLLKNAKDAKYALIDGLDEVDFNYRQTAEEIIRKIEKSPNFSYIIVASRYLPKKEMGGFRTDFLNEYDVITLEPLDEDKIKALADKLVIKPDSFVYTLMSVPMYASMSMTIFAHHGAEIFDKITDEASYINTYFETLSLEKDKEFKIDRSGVSWDKIYEAAYETLRNKSFEKTDIKIPVSFNSLISIVEGGEGRCYLKCSSIRFLNFLAARHILNGFIWLNNMCVLNSASVKELLDFAFEPDTIECLRFCGEFLRHEQQREDIVKALNAEELKQDTEWYYNLCLIIIMCFNKIQDMIFALGICFAPMYFKRNEKASFVVNINCKKIQDNTFILGNNLVQTCLRQEETVSNTVGFKVKDTNLSIYEELDKNGHFYAVFKALILKTSNYVKMTIEEDCLYIGNIENPFTCFLGYLAKKETLIIKSECCYILERALYNGVSYNFYPINVRKGGVLKNIIVEDNNSVYKSVDGVLFSRNMKRLIRYPDGKCDDYYEIPQNVEIIEEWAFFNTTNIKSVIIPNSVSYIGKYCFLQCKNLKNVTFSTNLTYVGEGAFMDCYLLNKVDLPDSVTHIGGLAFHDCRELQDIKLPDGLLHIKEDVFSCTGLTSIVIHKNINRIGDNAFSWCGSLKSVDIADGVTQIGDQSFSHCTALENIVISTGVFLYHSTFEDCQNLKTIYYKGQSSQALHLKKVFGLATIYYYSEKRPDKPGNFWHYVNGTPIVW